MYRAGFIGSDMGGYSYRDGGRGDFAKENELIKHLRGDDQRALVASAARRVETIIRVNWTEAKALVERLVRERIIKFDSEPSEKWRERLDTKYGKDRRARGEISPAGDLFRACLRRCRRSHFLRHEPPGRFQESGFLCRSHSARREARRFARRGTNPI